MVYNNLFLRIFTSFLFILFLLLIIKTDTSLHENLEDLIDSDHHVDSVYC